MSIGSWEAYIRFESLIDDIRKIPEYHSAYGLGKLTGKDKGNANHWIHGGKTKEDSVVAQLIWGALKAGREIDNFQTFHPILSLQKNNAVDDQEPPDLRFITGMNDVPAVARKVRGLFEVKGAVGVSSSPIVENSAWANLVQRLRFGMSTLKSRRVTPREPAPEPHLLFVSQKPNLEQYDWGNPPEVYVTSDPRQAARRPIPDIVTSIGGASKSRESWGADYSQIERIPNRYVGLSILGDGITSDAAMTSFINGVHFARNLAPPFIELSPSCPIADHSFAQDVEFLVSLCRSTKKALGASIPLFVKLACLQDGLLEKILLRIAKYVDAVVLNNSLRVRAVSLDGNGRPYVPFPGRAYGGLSGPGIFDLAIASVQKSVSTRDKQKLNFAVIASGGATTVRQVNEMYASGADYVQVATAAIYDPLLATKAAFQMASSSAVSNVWEGLSRPPRDAIEVLAAKELRLAIQEFERESKKRELSLNFWTVETVWNDYLDSRDGRVSGLVRRSTSTSAPKKDDWMYRLGTASNKRL
jgi:dihydroorotate dehydrogenase